MNKVQSIMLGAATLSMLASCSSEFDGPQSTTDVQSSAVKVTAEIGAFGSRVSNFTTWDANDAIGLSTSMDVNIPYVTADASGKFTPKGSDILYIKGNSQVNVSGYYPYSDNVNGESISFNVVNDENPDFLFATASATRENPEVKFSFSHVMSRLVFNFNQEIDSYALKGLVTTGSFNIKTGSITNGDATGDITGTKSQTIAVFLPPQTMSGVKLSFVKDGVGYSATLEDYALTAGNQYTYSVELNETGVAVTFPEASTISGFTNNDKGKLTYTEQEPEMTVGDWYLNDGTTVSHTKTLSDEQKSKVIGIVVYAGNPSTTALATLFNTQEGAWKDKCDPSKVTVDYMAVNHPSCTHGVVMSINGRDDKSAFLEGSTTTTITEWWNGQESLKAATMAPCADDIKNSENTKIAASNRYFCLGLQNTYILEQYVEAGNSVNAITKLEEFRKANNVPEGTTGWYIPSPMEIVQFLYGNSTDGVKTEINTSLKAVNASDITNEQYWSSSEAAFKTATEGTNTNQWYFGRVKKATDKSSETVSFSADISKGDASQTYRNIYFMAF